MKMKQVKTSAVNLAYEESGPAAGEPLVLLHGWPDSPRGWDALLPHLHAAGYRTIAPYLRGFGPSTFRRFLLSGNPRRTGQPVALAEDMIDLADKLGLERFHFIGHDWGARTGYALAALHAHRLKSVVAMSVSFHPGKTQFPELMQARAFWYQWLLCTHPGEAAWRKDPVAYARAQWDTWSPAGWYTESQFQAAAKSWHGKDYADVVLQGYRSRYGHAPLDPAYAALQSRYEGVKTLATPTLMVQGTADACDFAQSSDGAEKYFTGSYQRVLVPGAGHFPQRENAAFVAGAVLAHLRLHG